MCSQRSRTYPVKTKFVESGVHPAIQIQELEDEAPAKPALATFELDAKKNRRPAEQCPNYEIDMQKLAVSQLDDFVAETNGAKGFFSAKASLNGNDLQQTAKLLDVLAKHYSYQNGGVLAKSTDVLNETFEKQYDFPACPFTFAHKLAAITFEDKNTLTMVVEQETAKTLVVPGEEDKPIELAEPVTFTSTYTVRLAEDGKVQATLDEAKFGNQGALDKAMKSFPSLHLEEDTSELTTRSDSAKSFKAS
jgi:hypothetical protein